MSKLSELIKELCPNGVEYKKLLEISEIQRGKRLVRNQLFNEGKYAVYQNSLTPLGYYDEFNCEANTTFVISAGAAGEIGYSKTKFWAADDCLYIKCNTCLENKFLYYCLVNRNNYIFSQVRKSSIPRLSRKVIEELEIPVPPLEIQREIVQILDNFTNLTAELTAELTARKRQYEYYRDKLLSFEALS